MTKDQLWEIYCEQQPRFAQPCTVKVTLTVRGLKKLHEESWRHGYNKGLQSGMDLQRKQQVADEGRSGPPDFIKDLLKGFKGQRSEDGGQRSGDGGQRSGDGGQRSGDGGQGSED